MHQQVEHLFRNEYGRVVSLMTSKYGISNLELIEDVVQDSFLQAMKLWGYQKVPDNPTAWLFRVAKNKLIDNFRRSKKINYVADYIKDEEDTVAELTNNDEINDSELKMIFACCHPSLKPEYQIILSLKLIGGFSNKELAEALLKKEETVAKSFTRAKKQFKEHVQLLKVPVQMALQSRLFIVLRVIYLLFTEGYDATTGSQVLKRDICYEALRLALLLQKNVYCQHPNLEALIALMCFHAVRFDARLNEDGELVTLEHQDRSKYNQELFVIGARHLENAGTQTKIPSRYHLEAAVSYYHCAAKSFNETDWAAILELYDLQLKTQYSPMAALNRIMPLSKVKGAAHALSELDKLEHNNAYESVGLFFAIKAELLAELHKDHKFHLEKAIDLTENELVKKHLSKKLKVATEGLK
ncbi:sigma-70 family RNA polymerase sigma factor [uncultured Croceitalea sp.]|uniref:RNA polymerase sigma factor n=1 Tax=uncultured Croceitalea sp. TaxID=1798908 RepID=UPI0033068CB8